MAPSRLGPPGSVDALAALREERDALREHVEELEKNKEQLEKVNERLGRSVVDSPKFNAFIAYRRADAALAAAWVRRSLIDYRLPKSIDSTGKRALTVFLDREFRLARNDFDDFLRTTIYHSEWLIVVASGQALEPASFVHKEVEHFVGELGRKNVIVLRLDGEVGDALPGALHARFPNIDRVDITGRRLRRYLKKPWPPSPTLELRAVIATLLGITDETELALILEEGRHQLLAQRRRQARWVGAAALAGLAMAAAVYPKVAAIRHDAAQAKAQHLFDEGARSRDVTEVLAAVASAPEDDPHLSSYATMAQHLFAELPPLRVRVSSEGVRHSEINDALDRLLVQSQTGKVQLFDVDLTHPSRGLSARTVGTLASGDPEGQGEAHLSPDGRWALLCTVAARDATGAMQIWNTADRGKPALADAPCTGSETFTTDSRSVRTTTSDVLRAQLIGTSWKSTDPIDASRLQAAFFSWDIGPPLEAGAELASNGWLTVHRDTPLVSTKVRADTAPYYIAGRFSSDGLRALVLASSGELDLLDVKSRARAGGAELGARISCGNRYGEECYMALAQDGSAVALAHQATVHRWDTKTWHEEQATIDGSPGGLVFSESGALLVGTRKEEVGGTLPPGSYSLSIGKWAPGGALARGTAALSTGSTATYVVAGARNYLIAAYDSEEIDAVADGDTSWTRLKLSTAVHHLIQGMLERPERWRVESLSAGTLILGSKDAPIEVKLTSGDATISMAGRPLSIPSLQVNYAVGQAFGAGGPFLARQRYEAGKKLDVFDLVTGYRITTLSTDGFIAFSFSSDARRVRTLNGDGTLADWYVRQQYSSSPAWFSALSVFATKSPEVEGVDPGEGALGPKDYEHFIAKLTAASTSGDEGAEFLLRQMMPTP